MRHGTRRYTTGTAPITVIAEMRAKIAANLRIDPERIRYNERPETGGQFGEMLPRWEIHYGDQWRELPWHHDGPLCVTRELVRRWYG